MQEIAYTYAQTQDSIPATAIVQVPPRQDEDPSFEFYDNARGQFKIFFSVINSQVFEKNFYGN